MLGMNFDARNVPILMLEMNFSAYNLLLQAREVILMGPWTGNAQKTGKTWQKYPFFSSTIEIARNLKISILQLAIKVKIMK